MKIVLGANFGDEAKGLTTSYLCQQYLNEGKQPIVSRFSGGQQCGHTVVHNGYRHVFANFGSATLQGVPTYWSEHCTFSPVGVLNEYNALKEVLLNVPKLYVNPLSPVTTPYDRGFNCLLEKTNNHGSCGMGVGATHQRQSDYYKLFVQDLFHEKILVEKLNNIKNYYTQKANHIFGVDINDFIDVIRRVRDIITIDNGSVLDDKRIVFEGSQGILLDQDFGFFPNVTRSNTTSKNAIEILKKRELLDNLRPNLEVYYVTRAYQTRHGNGFMTNEEFASELKLINTENETNITNEYQGHFRRTVLDLDLLKYSIQCDSNFLNLGYKPRINLVITCIDQIGEVIPVTLNGKLKHINVIDIAGLLDYDFNDVLFSRGDTIKTFTRADFDFL